LLVPNLRGDDFLDQFKPKMHPITTPSNQISTTTPQVDGNWKLVWSDEFDGHSLDLTKWQFEVNGKGGGNGELQYYTDRAANLQVRDGHLIIGRNQGTVSRAGWETQLHFRAH
jgi:subtilisin-like proprotein convertase family protein